MNKSDNIFTKCATTNNVTTTVNFSSRPLFGIISTALRRLFFSASTYLFICILLSFSTKLPPLQFGTAQASELNLSDQPLFIEGSKTNLLQLVLQRDNKLFFEAYPTYIDINNDGVLDTTYKPDEIDYYGYFDSYFCYQIFGDHLEAVNKTSNKQCTGAWSGDFLNYATMTRMDLLLAALYGGKRVVDTLTETRLRRAFVPWENHTWGVEYTSESVNGFKISNYTPLPEPSSGNRHLFATNNVYRDDIPYLRIRENTGQRIWDWVDKERTQGDGYASQEFKLDVTVCKAGFLESFCKLYPAGTYKPIGLLNEYGENDSMYFSLITGSYENNKQGGVLRQAMDSFGQKEVDLNTGIHTGLDGIITTLNAVQIPNDFEHDTFQRDCGWYDDSTFANGECRAWGNPLAEMMYEGLRYFSGIKQPTPEFYTTGGMDEILGLKPAVWDDPYAGDKPYGQCSAGYQLVISDPSPSYDGDQLPGSDFGTFTSTSLGSMHVGDLADYISSNEPTLPGLKFIGENATVQDRAPSSKMVNSLREIRGQSPEAPHREGSYYASSVAYYGHTNDINPIAPGEQKIGNFTLALGSPLPTIDVDINGNTISIVPFSRSVGGCGRGEWPYKLTNAIVGFNIESISETEGSIRISYEDHEQGADNDMDSLAHYSFEVINNQLVLTVDSVLSSTCLVQHMGYAISGTTNDGVHLVVRSQNPWYPDADYELDVPPGETPNGNWADGVPLPMTSTVTFTPSSTPTAEALPSPLWYAAKWGGFNDINGDGIPQTSEWDADGDGRPDNYFPVSNPSLMLSELRSVFQQVLEGSASASSVATSSGSLRSENKIYRADFLSGAWTGDVVSYAIESDGQVAGTPDWSAKEALNDQITYGSREIITYNPDSGMGVPFHWPINSANPLDSELSIGQVSALSTHPVNNVDDQRGSDRLDYIRGEQIADFRQRQDYLGDIIHSSPTLVGPPGYYYPDDWGTGEPESAKPYSQFAIQNRNRQRVVYVGANDGMLHAFDAGQWDGSGFTDGTGAELFAYIPSPVFVNLPELTHPGYAHKYFVDTTPQVTDVFINDNWRTVLIGGLRSGGQGIYALDVTEPDSITEATADQHVLWEFTDQDEKEVGFTFSSPIIARMANGKWAAIMSGGYNSSAVGVGYQSGIGQSSIMIIDIATGDLIRKLTPLDTGCQGNTLHPNGPTQPSAVDLDNDLRVDRIYAGDLNGCVYSFDVSATSASRWNDGELKHKAVDDNGNPAPISAPIVVGSHPSGIGAILYFGTGKYLEPSDQNAGAAKRRFYAIWDRGPNTETATLTKISEGNMLEQWITAVAQESIDNDGDGNTDSTVSVRKTSQEPIDWDEHEGWYIDLEFEGYYGEQVIAAPLLRDGKVLVATHIPTGDECSPNQDGWLMILDARSGSMLSDVQFDLNGDGQRNEATIAGVSGLVNPMADPTIIAGDNSDILLSQTPTDPELALTRLHSGFREGRLTWRELQP